MTGILLAAAILTSPFTKVCTRCGNDEATHWIDAIHKACDKTGCKEPHLLKRIILYETGNTPSRHEQNRTSSAYGLGQFLNSTWKSVGIKKTACSVCQVEAMIYYCRYRYVSVRGALSHWERRRWY